MSHLPSRVLSMKQREGKCPQRYATPATANAHFPMPSPSLGNRRARRSGSEWLVAHLKAARVPVCEFAHPSALVTSGQSEGRADNTRHRGLEECHILTLCT